MSEGIAMMHLWRSPIGPMRCGSPHIVAGTPFVMQDPPLDSMTAARTVALAFAASRAGAMLSGLYAGMGLLLLRHWGTGDVQWRVGLCGATTVLSVLLVVIALWIERMCKLPDPPANAQTSVA